MSILHKLQKDTLFSISRQLTLPPRYSIKITNIFTRTAKKATERERMNFKVKVILLIFTATLLVTGCSRKTAQVNDISDEKPVPDMIIYQADYKKVWTAALKTLSEDKNFKSMNEASGMIVTMSSPLTEGKKSKITPKLGRKKYSYSHSVKFDRSSLLTTTVEISTEVMINGNNLSGDNGESIAIRNHLHRELFDNICVSLHFDDADQCNSLFTDYQKTAQYLTNKKQVNTLADAQEALKKLGYKPGRADGILGKKTKRALRKYQKDNQLPVTGKPDEQTRIALTRAEKETTKTATKTIKKGAEKKKDIQLFNVQVALKKLGYNPGPSDGILGKKTENALRKYQEENNLPITGKPDKDTKISLGVEKAEEKKEPSKEQVSKQSPEPEAEPKKEPAFGTIAESTHLLKEPNILSERLIELFSGQKINILKKVEEFYLVTVDDSKGYVYEDFVQ